MEAFNRPDVSILVPCYNEERCISALYRRISKVCKDAEKEYELILVNDGSKDQTWGLIEDLCATDGRVVGVNLSRNFGQEASLLAGLSLCTGEFTLIIDADLQDPPELLVPMLEMMDEGADVVYGRRISRAGETWFKRLTAWAFYRVMERLAEIPVPRNTGTFRLMRRNVLDAVNAMPEQAKYLRGLVSWVGFRQVPLEYERHCRFAGRSNWPVAKMVRLALTAITAFSLKPLRIAHWVASASLLGGLTCLGVAVWASLFWNAMVACVLAAIGFVSIATAIQSALIGILGEYVGQALAESRHRPRYLIAEILNRTPIESRCHV